MAQYRPFAIAPLPNMNYPGTSQIGLIVIGVDQLDYYNNYEGLQWIAGPDEDTGIIIAYHDVVPPLHSNSATPSNLYNIGFLRAVGEDAFVQLVKDLGGTGNTAHEAKDWLNLNGYWTSYDEAPWAYGYVNTTPSNWFFYTQPGAQVQPGPPVNNGNVIFTYDLVNSVTLNPNYIEGSPASPSPEFMYFNMFDSNGIDYTTQFTSLVNNGGTIAITQNGQTSTYDTSSPNVFAIESPGSLGISYFKMPLASLNQSTSTDGPLTYNDPITLAFS